MAGRDVPVNGHTECPSCGTDISGRLVVYRCPNMPECGIDLIDLEKATASIR